MTTEPKRFFRGMESLDAYRGMMATTYTHDQSTPSDTWTITHNLARYPSITIVDSAGTVVVGGVAYVSVNQVVVTFSAAFSGKAFLN